VASAPAVKIVAAFAALYFIWGSTFLAIGLAVQTIPPLMMMATRSIAAGLILYTIARLRGTPRPSRHLWLPSAAAGALFFLACHGLLAYAQQHVPSGFAAVMMATTPFWFVLVDWARPGGKAPRVTVLAALIPGILGVVLLNARGLDAMGGAIDPMMGGLLLLSALFWPLGSLISRQQIARHDPLMVAALQLFCGGIMLAGASALLGEWRGFAPVAVSTPSLLGLAYLVGFGSVLAFTSFLWLLPRVSAPRLATYAYVNPVVAMLLGWSILGESIDTAMLAGSAMIIVSVALVTGLSKG